MSLDNDKKNNREETTENNIVSMIDKSYVFTSNIYKRLFLIFIVLLDDQDQNNENTKSVKKNNKYSI